MNRHLSIIAACLALVACSNSPTMPDAGSDAGSSSEISSAASSVASQPSSSSSSSVNEVTPLPVPFTVQAPYGEWDAIHEDACEEAAMIMVKHYLDGTELSTATAEANIQEMIAWQTQNGYGIDVSAQEMVDIAKAYYGLNGRVRSDVTVETIKEELAAGNPVILPVAGRELENPYFSGEGPWYHVLVVIGYNEGWLGDTFITNDPGTKRGAHYEYPAQKLVDAVHDWTGVKENIRDGAKAMAILER